MTDLVLRNEPQNQSLTVKRSLPFWDALYVGAGYLSALIVIAIFLAVFVGIAVRGFPVISLDLFLESPLGSGRGGGIASVIVSTGMILAICLAATLPLGLGTAVFLGEICTSENLLSRFIRRSLDVLAGVPSIVFGLFGNAFFCKYLGLGFSILSGGLTLALMALPIVIRSTEEGLRGVQIEYKLGAASLGIRKFPAIFHIFFPLALPSVLVGVVLGIGRALAETAALIFTSGYVDRMPESVMDSGRSLSVHIYDLAMNVPGGEQYASASGLVLIMLIFAINISVATVGRYFLKKKLMLVCTKQMKAPFH